MRSVRVLVGVCLVASCAAGGGHWAWMRYGAADSPARVASILFEQGKVMAPSTRRCWGVWCAAIIDSTRLAYIYIPEGLDLNSRQLWQIQSLECENVSTHQTSQCGINMRRRVCTLWVKDAADFNIVCPTDVNIER
jgi:hypothetical protein